MIENMDPEGKIISLDFDTIDQFAQCWHGYKWVQDNTDATHVMWLDTDEVWDSRDLTIAKNIITMNPGYDFYKTNLYTYIKSPLFRVDPYEPLEPVSFVKANLNFLGNHARCCDNEFKERTFLLRDSGNNMARIFYHHYVYVREDFNTVLEKIVTSHVSEHRFYQDMSKWIPEVWNKLPKLEGIWEDGFHPAIGFRVNWKNLEEIKIAQMPKILRENNFPILGQFGVVN
jgi:hypothetical protein